MAGMDPANSSLLWALWNNIDPSELTLPRAESEMDRQTDTLSVQSYDTSYKRTPSFAFPSRKSQYAKVIRVRARQNEARTRYCSTAPSVHKVDEEIVVLAKSSTFCEHSPRVKIYQSDTFLTEMPEFYSIDPEMENISKISMPAFLPTIQAKTHTKHSEESKSSVVKRYLQENDITDYTSAPTPTEQLVGSHSKLSLLLDLEKSVLPQERMSKSLETSHKRKASKYKTRYKPTGNKKKKVGKLYMGKNRELSSTTNASGNTNNSSSMSYHSFITPQSDLITHFSRISMRQVQATINNNRLAILPNIS